MKPSTVIQQNQNENCWFARFTAADREGKVALAQSPQYRAELTAFYTRSQLEAMGVKAIEDWSVTNVLDAEEYSDCVGKTLGDIAAQKDCSTTDAMLDLVAATNAQVELKIPAGLSQDPVRVAESINHPQVIPGNSDGGAHNKMLVGGQFQTDLIEWLVKEENVVSLEQMHYKLSYLAARVMGFEKRGALLEGLAADIMIYDLDELGFNRECYTKLNDQPEGDWRWAVYAEGVQNVIVNGEVIFNSNNECTGATPGRMI